MTSSIKFEIEIPDDLARFRLPDGVQERLHTLLDKQDSGQPLTGTERHEAEGLVDLADLLSLLRLRAERISAPVVVGSLTYHDLHDQQSGTADTPRT